MKSAKQRSHVDSLLQSPKTILEEDKSDVSLDFKT